MVNVKPVTLYDVAEYAGVSYQTVSRVVNQASHVSAKTREKVEAAMAELNYIPNRVAQQLAGKQSLLIGVATSSLALHAPPLRPVLAVMLPPSLHLALQVLPALLPPRLSYPAHLAGTASINAVDVLGVPPWEEHVKRLRMER